jgi:hypothetical protein
MNIDPGAIPSAASPSVGSFRRVMESGWAVNTGARPSHTDIESTFGLPRMKMARL